MAITAPENVIIVRIVIRVISTQGNVMRMGARCQGFGHQYVMVRNQIMQSNTLYSKMSIM